MNLMSLKMFPIRKLAMTSCMRTNIMKITHSRCMSTNNDQRQEVSEEIYSGGLTKQIYRVKLFSLTTSLAGIIAQPILYRQATEVGGGLLSTVALGSIVGFFTFVTPFMLHYITKKYITKITYNRNERSYTATVISFFMFPKKIVFKPENVEIPDVPGLFTTFKIRNQPVFVDSSHFKDTTHYIKIMGFDKPIDLKLEELDDEVKKDKIK